MVKSRDGDNWARCYCEEGGTVVLKGVPHRSCHIVYDLESRKHPVLHLRSYMKRRLHHRLLSSEEACLLLTYELEETEDLREEKEMEERIFDEAPGCRDGPRFPPGVEGTLTRNRGRGQTALPEGTFASRGTSSVPGANFDMSPSLCEGYRTFSGCGECVVDLGRKDVLRSMRGLELSKFLLSMSEAQDYETSAMSPVDAVVRCDGSLGEPGGRSARERTPLDSSVMYTSWILDVWVKGNYGCERRLWDAVNEAVEGVISAEKAEDVRASLRGLVTELEAQEAEGTEQKT